MPMNPFKRSKSPFEQTQERLEKARLGVAETARGIGTVADGVASALDDDSQHGRRAPLFAAGATAFLGLTYIAAKRLGVASAVTKEVEDVRSGAAESAGGAGDAVESATSPASAPANGGGG
jgi:hypothetical protein